MLVVARGFVPAYTTKHIEPEAGDVPIALKPHDLDRRRPERVFEGGLSTRTATRWPARSSSRRACNGGKEVNSRALGELGIDPLAVTDDDGTFRLGVGQDGDALYLMIKAPFLAPEKTQPLAAGPTTHTITLGVGVTVRGSVVKQGKPLANVEMGMVQVDRNVVSYLGHFEFATDRNGKFNFVNIPPNQSWYLYGLMDSLKGVGSIPHGESQKRGAWFDPGAGRDRGPARVPALRAAGSQRWQAGTARYSPCDVARTGLGRPDRYRGSGRPFFLQRPAARAYEPFHQHQGLPSLAEKPEP